MPTYGRVTASGVRPGVDVTYYGTGEQLEYDFVIAPGTSPSAAAMIVDGADGATVDANGDLALLVGARTLRQRRPVAWQERDGRRLPVEAGFTWDPASRRIGFDVGAYDASLPLVIDPVLVYSSWFGGPGADEFLDVALDANGFIYVLGVSRSGAAYPTTPGAFQPAKQGSVSTSDYVVTKFNPAGTAVVYSTYFGGSLDDYTAAFNLPGALAVDLLGQVHIAGETKSTDFPVTAGRHGRPSAAARSTRCTRGCPLTARLGTAPTSAAPTPIRPSAWPWTRQVRPTSSVAPTPASRSSSR